MRGKHHYTIKLVFEERDDYNEPFTITEKVIFKTNKRAIADLYYYQHQYLNTPMESNESEDYFLHIQTIVLVKDY